MSTRGPSTAQLPPYSSLDEPRLIFNASDPKATDSHPLRGLGAFGPFSKASMVQYTPTVRVATVGPASGHQAVRKLVASLRDSFEPSDRRDYVPLYPGFRALFGAEITLADAPAAHVTWPEHLSAPEDSQDPSAALAKAIRRAVAQLGAVRGEFDVAFVHLPDAWEALSRTQTFDAHDFLKAIAALEGIPTQVVNDRVFSFGFHASRSWRLAIAQYVKAGGTPWKLARVPGTPDASAFIGLAYALRGDPTEGHFVTCCSQVFDADGGGMQFVAYEAADPVGDVEAARRNPFLSRSDMRAVLARSLRIYQQRNGGAVPKRVAIHKLTGYTDDELAGAADALAAVDEIECLEVTTDVGWRGVWHPPPKTSQQRTQAGGYPVPRGTMVPLSGTDALLWGAGDVPEVGARGHFYQGGKSIPRPLLLRRHAGSGPLELPASESLALSKMDWNNDALYDPVPVTIQYSRRLARVIAQVRELPNGEYPYRMFM